MHGMVSCTNACKQGAVVFHITELGKGSNMTLTQSAVDSFHTWLHNGLVEPSPRPPFSTWPGISPLDRFWDQRTAVALQTHRVISKCDMGYQWVCPGVSIQQDVYLSQHGHVLINETLPWGAARLSSLHKTIRRKNPAACNMDAVWQPKTLHSGWKLEKFCLPGCAICCSPNAQVHRLSSFRSPSYIVGA